MKKPPVTVTFHPATPLLIYDGECSFCKFWIRRWQRFTRDRVEYIASQDPLVAKQFPDLPRERYGESVQLVETDGRVYDGAEAVFRSLNYGRTIGRLPWWLYRRIPGFKFLSEWGYGFVARHRGAFSSITRLFWGKYE